ISVTARRPSRDAPGVMGGGGVGFDLAGFDLAAGCLAGVPGCRAEAAATSVPDALSEPSPPLRAPTPSPPNTRADRATAPTIIGAFDFRRPGRRPRRDLAVPGIFR